MLFRQEVLNVALAEILADEGMVSVPEAIIKNAGQRRMPDVLVEIQGLRLMIEGEIGTEEPAAIKKASDSARARVEEALAHIALAVVYPEPLAKVDSVENLKEEMRDAALSFRVFTESKGTELFKGNPRNIAETLRRTLEELSREDAIKKAVAIMEAGLEVLTREVLPRKGVLGRFAIALGISPPESGRKKDEEDYNFTVAYVGALSLLNALIFHEVISSFYPGMPSLKNIDADSFPRLCDILNDAWTRILTEINYYPIFHLGRKILLSMTSDPAFFRGTKALMSAACDVVSNRAALRHDLAGRVYHRLLANAKYMGTFYTSIPAATLLLKLALSRRGYPVDWSKLDGIGDLRMADLACGTGTLLMAAADAVTDNHIRASVEAGVQPRVDELQRILMEKTLYGFDILPSAVHLTASTLAMRAPETPVKNMNLFSLPLGGDYLGSIDFLRGRSTYTRDLFGALVQANHVNPRGEEEVRVSLPDLDLCVMNPPFTRSVGGNLLFGWLPDKERAKLQKLLKKIVEEHERASIQAGLGSVFVRVAHKYMKPGSRLALVLPKAVLSGVAWGETRELISRNYTLDYVVQSYDPTRWNFSENTDLSEVLVIATRGLRPGARTVFVNLWENPDIFNALAIARTIEGNDLEDLLVDRGDAHLVPGQRIIGTAYEVSWDTLRKSRSWLFYCSFARTFLTRLFLGLLEGRLEIPGRRVVKIPVVPLGKLGEIGPDRSQVEGTFKAVDTQTLYQAFWGHDAKKVFSIRQSPNKHLSLKRRKKDQIWFRGGQLLLAERLRLNTQRLMAIHCEREVLSNVWWPVKLKDSGGAKILSLWLNSTPGIVMYIGHRLETQGAWVCFKKATLKHMPVLNPAGITPKQREILIEAYEEISGEPLLPFPKIAEDPNRKRIDKVIEEAFRLPDLSQVREFLATEPIISLRPLA